MVPESQKVTAAHLFSRSSWYLWLAIFMISLVCRLTFLTFGDQLPVFWDARLYASSALGILGYLDGDEPFARGTSEDGDYSRVYETYLDGEDIDWLYYHPPRLSEAQKYLFYSGPVYPAMMVVVFALPWDNDFQAVRWLNAILDSLSLVILSMLAYGIWGSRRICLLTAGLQLCYLPLIITTGILGLETVTSFFIALFMLAVYLGYDTEKRIWFLAAGAVGGVLFLCKPTAVLLTVPALVFWGIVYFRRLRFLNRALLLYIIPFLFMVVPWTIFTSDYYGRLAIRDPEYSTANLRSSSSIEYEGYDLDFTDPDFWTYPVLGRIVDDPVGYVNLLSKKLIRLWWTPHDEFWQGPRAVETMYHRLLVVLALFGAALGPWGRNRFLLIPLFIVLYYTGIHTIFHSVPRYNFNALPGLFLLAVTAIAWAAANWPALMRHKRRLGLLAGLAFLLIVLTTDAVSGFLVRSMPPLIPIFVTLALLAGIGYVTYRLLSHDRATRTGRLLLWLPVAVLAVTSITGWTRPQLTEWSTRITDTKMTVVTEIDLPPDFRMLSNDIVTVVVDMTSDSTRMLPVDVSVNGIAYSFVDGWPPMDKAYYIKGTYRAFDRHMGLDNRGMRWYRSSQISPEKLAETLETPPKITVRISLSDTLTDIGEGIALYGRPVDPDVREVCAPSFSHNSIERFKELGDRRVYETYRLSSQGARSYLERDGRVIGDDLSAPAGDRQGRYNIYLFIRRADFSVRYY